MASVQVTNQLTTTDKDIPTPRPNDGSARTRAKDYLLEVGLVNQPISIDVFKDLSTSFDPYVQVFQVPKGSRGANVADGALLLAQVDDGGSGVNSKIPSSGVQYSNGAGPTLTSLPGVDYVVRVTSLDTLTQLPQPFTLEVSTPSGTVTLKDPITGAPLNPAGSSGVPVARFFDKTAGGHFYTTDPIEKSDRLTNPARFQSEGDEFTAPGDGNAKVQRFLNTASGTYFFTNKPGEIQFVRTLPQFRDQGEVFNSYSTAVPGAIPVYRFTNLARERENSQNITHFFTADPRQRRDVQVRSDFRDEGVAFYALPPVV
ncbi:MULTISPECIES: hypothetical protein [unclassified Microcoleus]|uniref:hypothetical protein n=1 Tax=unclassified Microcoleus TaxID=2642155 RepID=UPI002FD474D3